MLWEKTDNILFFETGEGTELRLLDIDLDPARWVEQQLSELCPGGSIKILGGFDRGKHKKIKQDRSLFAVIRD